MSVVRYVFSAIWDWMNRHPFPPPSEPVVNTAYRWTDDDDAEFASFVHGRRHHG